jgi:hypothetical protein
MKKVKAQAKAAPLHWVGLPILCVALLWTAPHLAVADAARSEGGPIAEGVYIGEVVLASFAATAAPGQIVLGWETEIELNNRGFNLYRVQQHSYELIKLNSALIASQASGGQGAAYEFVDTSGMPGSRYDYLLESVDMQGLPTYLSTTTAQVPAEGQVSFRAFLPMVSK